MRIENLKNPGTYSGGQSLRARVAHAISFAETVNRGRTGTVSPSAKAIADFLADAASKCPGYEAPSPELPANQAIVVDGDNVLVSGVDGTIEVVDGAVVGVNLEDTATVVETGTVLTVTGGTVTLTVEDGVLSAEFTPDEEGVEE